MKNKKRLLALVACVLIINVISGFTLLNIHAEDQMTVDDLETSKVIDTTSLSADQLYTVSGNVITGMKATVDKTSITDLTIPNEINGMTILSVGSNAFQGLPNLKKVVFEANAAKDNIGQNAFSYCPSLVEVIVNSSISNIDKFAFDNCGKLSVFPFDKITTSIGESSFRECKSLTKIMLSDTLTSTGRSAFQSCENVTEIHIPENANYTEISNQLFSSIKNISEIKIPTNITLIDKHAFNGCTNLKNVTIPNTVTKIGTGAFQKTGLETLTLPGSVMQLDIYAFNYCKNLKSIIFEEGIDNINPSTFTNNRNLKEVTFPTTLKSIGSKAFMITDEPHEFNQGLEKVSIPSNPNSQIYIEPDAFKNNSIKELHFGNINKILFTEKSFAGQKVPIKLYKTDSGYYLDFKQTGIKLYEKISLVSNSATEFTKLKDGIFKLNDSTVLPTKINYEYKLLDVVDISKVSGIDIVPSVEEIYTIIFKGDDGVVKGTEYILKDGKIEFPEVNKKGFTTVWDKGVESGLRKEYTFTYKALPKLVGKSEILLSLNTPFEASDYFTFIDSDGNKLDNTIFEGSVNIGNVGIYTLRYTSTDKWGGVLTGKVTINVVDNNHSWRELVDIETQIKASGIISRDGKLIIEHLGKDNELTQQVDGKHLIIGSYEVRIEGQYTGALKVTFPIDKRYEGQNIYIMHLKQDGTIENDEQLCKDGKVSIEVDELSPFLLTVDKKEGESPGQSTKPTNPDKPVDENQSGTSHDKVETGDSNAHALYAVGMGFALFIMLLLLINKRKKRSNLK